jgi:probable rRNA maturation factor
MIKANVVVGKKSWKKKVKSPIKYFNKKLKKVSKVISFVRGKNIIFTLLLTNSLELKKLNKKFRNRNKATDVLSFPYFSYKKLKLKKEKKLYIGDIAVSYEIVNSRSKESNFFLEFDKVWIHGFLHLLGYDHIKNKDYLKMTRVEENIINLIN